MIKILLMLLILSGCASVRYPNWEYVRIEQAVPDVSCAYKMQEACSLELNQCLDWHKKRATKYNANTVVITSKENMHEFSASGWTGSAKSTDNNSTLAEYYFCNGAKNITPK